MKKSFATKYGAAYNSSIEDFLDSKEGKALQGKVQLIFTSPPFPLVVPKKYGNKIGEDYLNWMAGAHMHYFEAHGDKCDIFIKSHNKRGRKKFSNVAC